MVTTDVYGFIAMTEVKRLARPTQLSLDHERAAESQARWAESLDSEDLSPACSALF